MLNADPVRITQAISNLLHNSLKFTPAKGRVDVRVTAVKQSGEARLCIADTGIGIAPEVLARLFEPFSQADQSLARIQGGLGLGLAIVKGMVDLHGGRVEANSAGIGHGAAFTIHLPLA